MKAILVLDDMPIVCNECPLLTHIKFNESINEHICMADSQKREVFHLNAVPSWCPLKYMPEKRILPSSEVNNTNYGEEPWFSDGWNACLEEIEE